MLKIPAFAVLGLGLLGCGGKSLYRDSIFCENGFHLSHARISLSTMSSVFSVETPDGGKYVITEPCIVAVGQDPFTKERE